MKKRTWHYCMRPAVYDISCDLCGGTNIEWSEFERRIWCYDCQKDTLGNPGIFDGPIASELCAIFGISLDRIDIESGKRLKMTVVKDRLVWK